MIPKLIHAVWIDEIQLIPPKLRSFLKKWEDLNSGYGLMLWGNKEIIPFLNKFYPQYLGLWNHLKNPGKKSDLIRYLILAKYGGFYVDADLEPLKSLDHFLAQRFVYSLKDRRTDNPSDSKYPIDFRSFDIIIGADNYSARPTNENADIITNCFIATIPSSFWEEFVKSRIDHYEDTVLNSFGTWALTDFIRSANSSHLLELPSYYFNWNPAHLEGINPKPYTYALHHSEMKWNQGKDWYNQK